jgi:holo-[acyl-carrier-protein] synthase
MIERDSSAILSEMLNDEELLEKNIQSIAGIISAKEAIKKAFDGELEWKDISVSKTENGKPYFQIKKSNTGIISSDLSISHDGEYACACAVCLIN